MLTLAETSFNVMIEVNTHRFLNAGINDNWIGVLYLQ